MSRPPLARLFAVGSRRLVEGLHRELRERGWTDLRPAYGFVLLAARETTTVGDLATLMGMTKQAASKLVDDMVLAGYLVRSIAADDARRRPIDLSERGTALLAEVEAIYAEVEQVWARRLGAERFDRLRDDLEELLLDPTTRQLPPVRPLW